MFHFGIYRHSRAYPRGVIGSTVGAYPRGTGSNPVEGNGHFFPSYRQLYLSSFSDTHTHTHTHRLKETRTLCRKRRKTQEGLHTHAPVYGCLRDKIFVDLCKKRVLDVNRFADHGFLGDLCTLVILSPVDKCVCVCVCVCVFMHCLRKKKEATEMFSIRQNGD